MFQTEPIIYLQSLGNQWFTHFMIQITNMGTTQFLVPIIVVAIFGVDFKKGFLLFQLFLWTNMVTETLKILVGFPRPDFVDNRVINLELGIKNISPFSGNGMKSIFALPDKQLLKAFRLQEACGSWFSFRPCVAYDRIMGRNCHFFQQPDNQDIDSFCDSINGFFKSISRETFHRRCIGWGYCRINFPRRFCTFSQKPSKT